MFKYRLKVLLNDKTLLFWTAIFPMLLAILFHLVLSSVFKGETLDTINIGVSDDAFAYYEPLLEILEAEDIVSYTVINDTSYQTELKEETISAYITYANNTTTLTAETLSTNVSILESIFTNYDEQVQRVTQEFMKDPVKGQAFLDHLIQPLKETDTSAQQNSIVIIHLYTTIAMMIIYTGNWGQKSAEYLNPMQTKVGLRTGISPVSKRSLVLSDLLVIYSIFIVQFIIQSCFLHFALNVPLGNNLPYYIGTGLAGGMMSISLGYCVSVLIKSKKSRDGFISMFGIFSTFLAGMQSTDIKRLVDVYAPILTYINPASLITDNFYFIYMDINSERIVLNIILMGIYSLLLGYLAYSKMKELSYDHI